MAAILAGAMTASFSGMRLPVSLRPLAYLWLATLAAAVQAELDRVSQTLTGRIRQLAERYATPLPQLTDEVAALAARVKGHLKKLGAIWA